MFIQYHDFAFLFIKFSFIQQHPIIIYWLLHFGYYRFQVIIQPIIDVSDYLH